MSAGSSKLPAIIKAIASHAIKNGVTDTDIKPGGELHEFVAANVAYRPETEFFVLFLVACEIAEQLKKPNHPHHPRITTQ